MTEPRVMMTDEDVTAEADRTAAVLASLPGQERVGDVDDWSLSSNGKLIHIHAKFLGMSSSYRMDQHEIQHPGRKYVGLGDRPCGSCRWIEFRLFREVNDKGMYFIHRAGMSILPGESTRTRHEYMHTGHEVVEWLTTRRRDGQANQPMKCPICDGTGYVSYPPGVAGDQHSRRSNGDGPYICHACTNGIIYQGNAHLTAPAARVLAQAAGFDDGIDDAYINRVL